MAVSAFPPGAAHMSRSLSPAERERARTGRREAPSIKYHSETTPPHSSKGHKPSVNEHLKFTPNCK